MIEDIVNKVDIVKLLNNYYIVFGILEEDKYREIKIDILNPDESISQALMSVGDVMYLTETGTITLPGKHILQRLLYEIDYKVNQIINEIIDNIFNNNWSEMQIDSKMEELELHLQEYIKSRIRGEINGNISTLLGIKNDKEYLYNYQELERYIKCKVLKN